VRLKNQPGNNQTVSQTISKIVAGDRLTRCGDKAILNSKHLLKLRRRTMKLRIRILGSFTLVALTIGLFSLAQSASAVSDCKQARGNLSGGGGSGTITQGGRLNGTTQAIFTSAFTPTPDPNTFSFTDDLTITTNKGVLKTHNVGIFDFATGLFSAIDRIDPNSSTGDFAGATGALYINGKTTDGGATIQAEITGEICFAN
jgi:hypothetical protein